MIALSTLNALCKEAGLDPTRVSTAVITPDEVTFTVYSVNIYGELMANAERTKVVSHWVKAKVDWAE